MHNKLITLAVAAAIATPVAVLADVKIGGFAQVEIAREEATTTTGTTSTEANLTTTEDNSRGRFWITADEDLGHGMKGLAHFEFRVDTTGVCESEAGGFNCGVTGGATAADTGANVREKWVGLKAPWGTVKAGSVRSPYKYAGGVLLDTFVTTNLEARGTGGMSGGVFGHNNFMDNAVSYNSPSLAGFTFNLTYGFDDAPDGTIVGPSTGTSTSGGGNASTTDDGDYAASIEWNQKFGDDTAVMIAIANADNQDNTPAQNAFSASKIAAKLDFLKYFTVKAQIEALKDDSDVVDDDVWFFGFDAKLGAWVATIQVGKTEQGGTGTNNDTDYLALGGIFNFSKTFIVFGGWRSTDTDQTLPVAAVSTEFDVLTVGARKSF